MAGRGEQAVVLQVCGRRERVMVPEVSARALAAATERTFDVRPPFQFADRAGRLLGDDAALAAQAAAGDAFVVRLTEGVLYDFGRRVDQIRHLQWGFVADQLAALRQERPPGQAVELPHEALRQETAAREAADAELQRGLAAVRELLAREREAREARLAEAEARAEAAQGRLRQAVESCHSALRKDKEDIQSLLLEEANSREESSQRLRREMHDLRTSPAEDSRHGGASVTDVSKLSTLVQGHVARTVEGWAAELRGLAGTVRELESSLDEVKSELRRTRASHTAKEVDRDEPETARKIEEVRRGLEREAQERKLLLASVERLSQELTRRTGDEAKERRGDVERLYKLISDESERRLDVQRRLNGVGGEEGSRELRQLEGSLAECRDVLRSEMMQWSAGRAELERRAELCQAAVSRLREDCKEAMQREVRSRVDRERSLREELEARLAELRTELHHAGSRQPPPAADPWLGSSLSGVPGGGAASPISALADMHSARMAREPSDQAYGRPSTPPRMPRMPELGGAGIAVWPS